jgi:hypothetical protein
MEESIFFIGGNMIDESKKLELIKEYEVLCRKYNLMILSEGEIVEVGKADDTLWGILVEEEI